MQKLQRFSLIASILFIISCACFVQADQNKASALRQTQPKSNNIWVQALLEQGLNPGQIQQIDKNGIPLVCGYTGQIDQTLKMSPSIAAAALPANTRSWETIPNVIRTDGIDTFRLEVNVNGPVNNVTMRNVSFYLIPPATQPFSLRDDGLYPDRVANDYIYTAGPFRFNTSLTIPFLDFDPNSPEGLYMSEAGNIYVTELDGSTYEFLISPQIGYLRSDITPVPMYELSPEIIVSPHLINLRTANFQTQKHLRNLIGTSTGLTLPVYKVLPDRFDFFIWFSTNRIERLPRTSSNNFVAGNHLSVKVDYTGTGINPYDFTPGYGSAGRLLGINALDSFSRGIAAGNATHELLHQWSAYISSSFGLKEGGSHYNYRSNVASLIGGYRWINNGDTTYTVDCTQGLNRAYHAPALDKYMMGLIDAADVPTYYAHIDIGMSKCVIGQPVLQSEIVATVPITDIITLHGLRSPGPDQAQRIFNLAFLAETNDRFLNETEMTFYDVLAAHYTKIIPASKPDPYVEFGWVPMTRYFGESTHWSSRVFISADLDRNGEVNFEDFAILASHWLQSGASQGDISPTPDGDGTVNIFDLILLAGNWLETFETID